MLTDPEMTTESVFAGIAASVSPTIRATVDADYEPAPHPARRHTLNCVAGFTSPCSC